MGIFLFNPLNLKGLSYGMHPRPIYHDNNVSKQLLRAVYGPNTFQTTLCVLTHVIFTITLPSCHNQQQDKHWQATELTYLQVEETGEHKYGHITRQPLSWLCFPQRKRR